MLASMRARMKRMRREDGTSVVELALIMGILGPLLLLGTTELSIYVYSSVELVDATHAAASYAAQYYFQNSNSALPAQSDVTTAATNDASELVSMLKSGTSFTATMATGCGTGDATAGNTVPTCTGGAVPYVQVTGTATVDPIASYFASPTITMTSRSRINLVK
jgi:Flp pilus assembly protein TadG